MMKKCIIGFVAGAIMASTFSVYAEEIGNLVGQKIQGELPVVVDEKALPKKAIVVDGSSYLPVRTVGEQVGYFIDFQDGRVIMKKQHKISNDFYKPVKPVKSNILKVQAEIQFVEADGSQFVPVHVFSQYVKYDPATKTITFTIDDKTKQFVKNEEYAPGTDTFFNAGETYIKLSAIGLKARIDGDTLWIEKQ